MSATKPACLTAFCLSFIVLLFFIAFGAGAQTVAGSPADSLGSKRNREIDTLLKKLRGITITGFMEPEFQAGQSKGENSFSGGNFSTNSSSRFIIRRGRVRTAYQALNKDSLVTADMCFELEATQRGVTINEFWGRVYETKWQLFSVAAGMTVRPFGNEITYATRKYESPERGRMSQTLMRGEADLGAVLYMEPRKKGHPLRYLKAAIGVFNGQGLTAPAEFDSYKDLVARLALQPLPISKKWILSGGISVLTGGIEQNNRFIYHTVNAGSLKMNLADSSVNNIGKKAPRTYYGADVQLKYQRAPGLATELRAEYWQGKQTASAGSSETPAALLQEPYFIRNFNGAFFYLLHNLTVKHQLVIKYDIYDPNTDVKKEQIGLPGTNLGASDIKYTTLGMGYQYYWSTNLRLTLWYDIVRNEKTQLAGFTSDLKDNVFTCRLQLKF